MNKKIISNEVGHGVPGQLSIYVLDADSDITNYGQHNRLLVFADLKAKLITVREDLIGLALTTPAERHAVAHGRLRVHPRGASLKPLKSIAHDDKRSIDHTYSY
jgi:hypothetical protein